MIKYIISTFLLSLCACSSTTSDHVGLLNIDFKGGSADLSIDSFEFMFTPLETNDSCLLSGIGQIEFADDKIYIIDSINETVFVFSAAGEFITQIGIRGNGPGEYVMPKVLYIDENNNIISIVDVAQSKILHYNLKTYQYLFSQEIGNVNDCSWLSEGSIAWFNRSGYKTDKREHYYLEITNSELSHLDYYYPADILTGYGVGLGRRFYQYGGHTYLSIPFFSIVHEITSQGVIPAYSVSFGKDKLPTQDWLLTHLSNDQNYIGSLMSSEYISAFNLNETDSYLATTYYAKNNNCYIAFYNKDTKKSYKYSLEEFMKFIGFNGVSYILGVYNNYFIVAIYPSELKKRAIENEELRTIAENLQDDSNFILCLFRLKE